MKNVLKYPMLAGILFVSLDATGQQFTEITGTPPTNQPSDSRSVNIIDLNGDGWDDIFITNGQQPGTVNMLYTNNGNGTFTAVTGDPIVSNAAPFDGATFGDVDNDGDADAFAVTWYGQLNYFYRNNGNGTFNHEPQNVTGTIGTYSETAAWGDYNNDGSIDLYITNSDGNKKNMLYQNDGTGNFTAITTGQPVTDVKNSRGTTWIDFDNDGDQDLFVANEGNQTNDFYLNDGTGNFSKMNGVPPVNDNKSSMSASWGDIDNDGDFDLFIANSQYFAAQNNQLFINNGNGSFTAVTTGDLVTDGGCSYGSGFADYDNDGDVDLFITNGYCNGTIENYLYDNDGTGNFSRNLSALADFTTPCSFGMAWGDLDNNGFQDLVISTCKNSSSSPAPNNKLFLNNGNTNHWLKIHATGTTTNRSAIGTRIYITALISGQTVTQMREISSQTGYCGQNSLVAHFGLGDATTIQNLHIEWPSGNNLYLNNLPVDTTLQITEVVNTGLPSDLFSNNGGLIVYEERDSGNWMVKITSELAGQTSFITVYDISGKKIWETVYDGKSDSVKIPKSFLTTRGIYVVRLIGKNQSLETKFAVK
jgi:hypothetical protein